MRGGDLLCPRLSSTSQRVKSPNLSIRTCALQRVCRVCHTRRLEPSGFLKDRRIECVLNALRSGLHRLEAPLSSTHSTPMPSRGFLSLRRPTVSSASPQSNHPNPGGSPSIAQPTRGPSTTPPPAYPDYINETARPGWDAALSMASMLDDIPSLPLALAGR
ncbi:hypothetical protein BS47DRAFT_868017 [Hydnum rufescens UP504]|uniref:Uncharacterized protein n=1 Tax=Hydnum rufescens UP504 TaxID=1448309 RepID=A0A9P6AZM6_9AGAM|nr:hypothetical protein BS47DRAFT_868017 [Hydnum rufescens UP504]